MNERLVKFLYRPYRMAAQKRTAATFPVQLALEPTVSNVVRETCALVERHAACGQDPHPRVFLDPAIDQ
ncbi:MAG: hypothetical protein R2853_03520 [Thermomicrobiales bacterium]